MQLDSVLLHFEKEDALPKGHSPGDLRSNLSAPLNFLKLLILLLSGPVGA